MFSLADMLLLNGRDRHTNSECAVPMSSHCLIHNHRTPTAFKNDQNNVFVLLHVNNKTSSSDGAIFPYFICTVMIATFKPLFSFPLTYIRPSIPVSQFPVVVPFLPSTRSKAFRLQPQSCYCQKCFSALQGRV